MNQPNIEHALVPTQRSEQGSTDHYDKFEVPTPGTYWRLINLFNGCHDDRTRANKMKAGTVLLLITIEHADGEPHVYTFAPHPGLPKNEQLESHFHADDFLTLFERAPDGDAIRAKELVALIAKMDDTKNKMLSAPPDTVPVALLEHDPSVSIGTPGTALATPDHVKALTLRATRLKEDAEKRSTWIQKHSDILSSQGYLLANYHQERAQAALSRAHAQLEGVAGILRTVANLRLYTGEGVELQCLRDGIPATPEARLTIYQEVLALDEESLILLDQGGLDHTHTDKLIEALSDPALLNRLIPAERGIALLRFRSNYKEFVKSSKRASSAEKAQMARFNSDMTDESRRKRLLVRDGERLWLIDADKALAPMKQLMTSAGEQSSYFLKPQWDRTKPAETLTREDLDYAKAKRHQLGVLGHYEQVLIILWGLHDRENIFESAHIPKFSSWLDPSFQDTFLSLVSMDTLLPIHRPGFAHWQHEQNQYLAVGSWAAVDLDQAFCYARAPGAFNNGNSYGGSTHYDMIFRPTHAMMTSHSVLIARVQSDKDGHYVDVPCVYRGYRSRVSRPNRTIKLYVKSQESGYTAHTVTEGVLILDRANSEDLGYYLGSRSERRSYEKYLCLFRQARQWTDERDAKEATLRQHLRDAVMAARLPHEAEKLERQITDALAVARTARRDGKMPQPTDSGFDKYLKAALAALHSSITNHDSRIAMIDAWAKAQGREPLRLVITGKQAWKLYLVPSDAEHDDRLGTPTHSSIADTEFHADGTLTIKVLGRSTLRAVASEQVIHDWPAITKWLNKESIFRASYDDAIATLDMAIHQSKQFDYGIDLAELVKQSIRFMREKSNKYVERMPITIAIGSSFRQHKPEIVLVSIDALHYAYHAGDEKIKDACRIAILGIYSKKDEMVKELENKESKWSKWILKTAAIDLLTSSRKTKFIAKNIGRYFSEDDCVDSKKSAKANAEKPVKIQSLTPAGARLFPLLAQLTQTAIG